MFSKKLLSFLLATSLTLTACYAVARPVGGLAKDPTLVSSSLLGINYTGMETGSHEYTSLIYCDGTSTTYSYHLDLSDVDTTKTITFTTTTDDTYTGVTGTVGIDGTVTGTGISGFLNLTGPLAGDWTLTFNVAPPSSKTIHQRYTNKTGTTVDLYYGRGNGVKTRWTGKIDFGSNYLSSKRVRVLAGQAYGDDYPALDGVIVGTGVSGTIVRTAGATQGTYDITFTTPPVNKTEVIIAHTDGGRSGWDYSGLSATYLSDWCATNNICIFRYPISWDRLQTQLKGPLNTAYLNSIKTDFATADSNNSCLVIDIHNGGTWITGGSSFTYGVGGQVTESDFTDMIGKLVAEIKDLPAYCGIDLMNEPAAVYTGQAGVRSMMQAGIDAVRAAGDLTHDIYVEGSYYSSCGSWIGYGNDNFRTLVDHPSATGRIIPTCHVYTGDNTGQQTTWSSANGTIDDVYNSARVFVEWCKTTQFKVCNIGENGIGRENRTWWEQANRLFKYLVSEGVSYFGWSGGSQSVYGFNLSKRSDGGSAEQVAVYTKFTQAVQPTVYYATTTSVRAVGTYTFSALPTDGQNIVLYGVTWTFVASGATGNQTNIKAAGGGYTALENTLIQLVTDLNASTDAKIKLATYSRSGSVLNISFDTYGVSGNYYTLASGTYGGTVSHDHLYGGVAASGTISFRENPTAGQTIVLNGVTWTFVASGATGNQTNIKSTLYSTVYQLATDLNASSSASLNIATYTRSNYAITITYDTYGAIGNSYTLSSGTTTAFVSDPTLYGGADTGAEAITITYRGYRKSTTTSPITVSVDKGAATGTLSATSVVLSGSEFNPRATLYYTPAATETATISFTNDAGLTNPSSITVVTP